MRDPWVYPDLESCLGSTAFINSDHPSIRARVDDLDLRTRPLWERAVRVFEFVRDQIEYEFRAKLNPEEYVASYTLGVGKGFCTQKAVLLCALGRAAGIPTALVLADLRDRSLPERIVRAMRTDVLEYHGIVAFHLDGQWLLADATLSPEVVKRKHYRSVTFDGRQDALLPSTTLTGAPHVEYVRFHGAFADLPFKRMQRVFIERFKDMDLEALAKGRYRL